MDKEPQVTEQERQFAETLTQYENQWVAILRDGEAESVVANGEKLKEARRSAIEKGFKNVTFLKVPSLHHIFIGVSPR